MLLPRSPKRALAVLCFVAIVWILGVTLEPRRTAYSCRTLGSCLGLSGRHVYHYKRPSEVVPVESETILRDGTTRFDRGLPGSNPNLLFLVVSRDAASWSSDFRSTQRTAWDLMDILVSTQMNMSSVSIALMTTSKDEFMNMRQATASLPFEKATILLHLDEKTNFNYQERHRPSVQLARRSALAKQRNYLMLSALANEQHIVWLDADVVELSEYIVQAMIQHSERNKDAGIITALCHQNQMDNYDKNAWKVNSPDSLGAIADEDRSAALSNLKATRLMVPELIRGTTNDETVPLDSVGGTILYIRSELVRQGLVFPYANMVGTTWSHPGWIGVETEGLCYMAKPLEGGGCYVLGGGHHVRHSDWG